MPPNFGTKCEKETDPLCLNKCFSCCSHHNGNLPETNYLRCKNPQHPPYQESEFSQQTRIWREKLEKQQAAQQWKYPYDQPLPETKAKLKKAIQRDLSLLKNILPLEANLLLDEDDSEMWDQSDLEDLEKKLAQIKLILQHPQGLLAKLSIWEDYREMEAEENND